MLDRAWLLGYLPLEFAATRDGLWQLFEESKALDPNARLLDEPPKVKQSEQRFVEGAATSAVTSEQPGRWCVRDESGGMGQWSSWMFCVRETATWSVAGSRNPTAKANARSSGASTTSTWLGDYFFLIGSSTPLRSPISGTSCLIDLPSST